MADDAGEAWNALEILLTEFRRQLQPGNWRHQFSLRLLERVETLADRARINSPVRFHKTPFSLEKVVSLWDPWTIECVFAGTHAQICYETTKTTLENWLNWRHLYNAGGEPDLLIRNNDLWPPSGSNWDERTALRESECQTFLDCRDSSGLSNLFSASPRAFLFALDSWAKLFDSVYETYSHGRRVRSYEQGNEVQRAALAEVGAILSVISEALATVNQESDVAKFDCMNITTLKTSLESAILYNGEYLLDSHAYPNLFSARLCFENSLMQSWLTELAHSPTKVDLASEPDSDTRKHGIVPYWDDANSTLWLNGKQRCYSQQLRLPSRQIFKSLEEVEWSTEVPCSIAASQAQQCCKDRSNDNQLGIKFTYLAASRTVKATWKITASRISPNRPESPDMSPETP